MYIAKADITTYLNIDLSTNGGPLVDSLITAVCAFVDDYCNRTWTNGASTDITAIFDGGGSIFFPNQVPISSVISITDDGTAVDADDIFNYGTHIELATK